MKEIFSINKNPKQVMLKITDESFSDEGAREVISKLFQYNRRKYSVWLEISSVGGEVRALNTIVEMIDTCTECTINTIAYGTAYSCAAMLFLKGKERLMYKSAELIFHEPRIVVQAETELDYSSLTRIIPNLKKDYNSFIEQIKQKCNLSEKEIKDNLKDEWILSSQEAMELGFATDVVAYVKLN